MARINKEYRISETDYWQGLSDQNPTKRFSSQVKDSQNTDHNLLDGARDRQATDLLGSTDAFTTGDEAEIRVIKFRDKFIHISDTSVKFFDSDYTELSVEDRAGDSFAYLNGVNPLTDIDYISTVDTFIIVNKTTTVASEDAPMYAIQGTVNLFTDLSEQAAVTGDTFKVIISENLDPAGFYRRLSNGSWDLVAASGDKNGRITQSTMPHRLIYDEISNGMIWDRLNINDRRSGSDTNLLPRFVGDKIKCAAFLNARLWFLSSNAIEASRANDIFTFFVYNVADVNQSDRISYDIKTGEVGSPVWCQPIGSQLFVLCDSGLLSFGSGQEPLTSTNGYEVFLKDTKTLNIKPATNGEKVIFADQFNRLYSYGWSNQYFAIQEMGQTNAHIERTMQSKTIRDIYAIDNSTYVIMTDWSVYVNEIVASQDQLVKNSWSRYIFYDEGGTGGRTVSIAPWADRIRIIQSAEKWHILDHVKTSPVDPDNFNYSPRLDQRELLSPAAYDQEKDRTKYIHSGSNASLEFSELHKPNGVVLRPETVDKRSCWFEGYHTEECYLGFWYSCYMDKENQYVGGTPTARATIANITVFHNLSGGYKVSAGRDVNSLKPLRFQGSRTLLNSIGATTIETGDMRFGFGGDAKRSLVRFENVSGVPHTITTTVYGLNIRG